MKANAPHIADAPQRQTALDPDQSFIVQAPAGSGKTSLLVQRYLRLLARVNAPEEVVAITFTRKAASEMRSRLVEALARAEQGEPDSEHERLTWQLAREALDRDRTQQWELLRNPGRLRVQTIDSLCAWLTRQLPVVSGFGAQPAIVEDASELYHSAAAATLASLETGEKWSPAVARLLLHLDNDVTVIQGLLADMLARRDQWLRHVVGHGDRGRLRQTLERSLARVIEDATRSVRGLVSEGLYQELSPLLRFAAANLEPDHPLNGWSQAPGWPPDGKDGIGQWLALADWLLTTEGQWRKTVDKRCGFPAPSSIGDKLEKQRCKDMKDRMLALLAELATDGGTLRAALDELRQLPACKYDDAQWQVLEALLDLLPVAVAQLRIVFRHASQVDFTEVAHSAIEALGQADEPTDLALALDHRIQHLLVDEFQDTSFGQYQLLERLTAGWQAGDGRTVFLVGDPMQSIYRFREAEVGLFLWMRRNGLAHLPLTPLTLSVNFRSRTGVVEWVNRAFPHVLAQREDIETGAVSYSPSVAFHGEGAAPAVQFHPQWDNDPAQEAQLVCRLVQDALAAAPESTVAILVQARRHLAQIALVLKQAGVRFQAIDIEHLSHRPVIQDLLALTRCLLHPLDRTAWLAVLRAPWCGASLRDLKWLVGDNFKVTLWERLNDQDVMAGLRADGRLRVERLRKALHNVFARRGRCTLCQLVEELWLALNGPACVSRRSDLDDARVFLHLLDELESTRGHVDPVVLEQRMARLFAMPDPDAGTQVQLMTVHKAKGLEFDTVILPGMGRAAPNDSHRLLMWMERPSGEESGDLLLAPIGSTHQGPDSIYSYLRWIDRRKAEHEAGRLLYVAATRARERLHLVGHAVARGHRSGQAPAHTPWQGSLLARLWPVVESDFHGQPPPAEPFRQRPPPGDDPPPLRRLPAHWRPPQAPPSLTNLQRLQQEALLRKDPEAIPEFQWATAVARHVGTLVHQVARQMAEQGLDGWDAQRVSGMEVHFARALERQGLPDDALPRALARVSAALVSFIEDPRGRWLLQQSGEARCEYGITGVVDGHVRSAVMDRTFIARDGVRWIVDYKVGAHEGRDVESFIDNEFTRYRGQLERYAALMAVLDPRPIQLGLYFPLLRGWREWSYES